MACYQPKRIQSHTRLTGRPLSDLLPSMTDIVFLSAGELAAAIRSRDISAVAALEAHIAQIERHNPALNAVVTRDEAAARARAALADAALARGEVWGPLHGVPITVKDAFETKGMRTTASFKRLSAHVPGADATVVARVRAAGAIVWGKTNMPELAMDFQSNSPVFGRADNPWDTGRTPGGSSGGGAAAVAAGLSPFELGSDLAGSIRIPAHFCGVFGFKPTENRVSTVGHIPGLPGEPRGVRHMGCPGILARSVSDLRLVFPLIAGPDEREVDVPPVPLGAVSGRPLGELRVAWSDELGGLVPGAETRGALEKLAAELGRRGVKVERRTPPGFDFAAAGQVWGELFGAEICGVLPLPIRLLFQLQFGTTHLRDPVTPAVLRGASAGLRDYAVTLARRDELIAVMERFLSQWDVWLCPVSSVPAIPHCKPGENIEVDGVKRTYFTGLGGFTMVFSLTGQPVVVLPLGRTRAGLPIGVQVVARRWSDDVLLDVAEKLSAVTGAFERPPGF
jgi:amidase